MSNATAMRFKAQMNKVAKSFGLRPQTVIQNFMFERFLDRLSQSEYRETFVIKGGVLISSMLGLRARSTMDMDATAIGLPMSVRSIRHAIGKVAAVEVDDGVAFKLLTASPIRLEVEGYGGIRVKLVALFNGLRVPVSVDVTAGDVITPKPIAYAFPSSFEGRKRLSLLAYPIETILAEKCESILKRNVVGSRPRDYYDIYMLTKLKRIRPRVFRTALRSTFAICGTLDLLNHADEIIDLIVASPLQKQYWQRYQAEFSFARDITFQDVVAATRKLLT